LFARNDHFKEGYYGRSPNPKWSGTNPIPDYSCDLNAMHEAECNAFMIMGARGDWSRYVTILSHVIDQLPLPKNLNERYVQKWIGENHATFRILYATARQRAEAFVLTMEDV